MSQNQNLNEITTIIEEDETSLEGKEPEDFIYESKSNTSNSSKSINEETTGECKIESIEFVDCEKPKAIRLKSYRSDSVEAQHTNTGDPIQAVNIYIKTETVLEEHADVIETAEEVIESVGCLNSLKNYLARHSRNIKRAVQALGTIATALLFILAK